MPQKYWITSHVSQYIFGPRFFHTVSTSLKIKRMASHGSNQQKTWSLKSQFWLWSQWSILKKSNAVPYKFWFCLQCCTGCSKKKWLFSTKGYKAWILMKIHEKWDSSSQLEYIWWFEQNFWNIYMSCTLLVLMNLMHLGLNFDFCFQLDRKLLIFSGVSYILSLSNLINKFLALNFLLR